MITGRLTATFVAESTKDSARLATKNTNAFEVNYLNNINVLSARRINSHEYESFRIRRESYKINNSLNNDCIIPFSEGVESHQIDWNQFYFINPEFIEIKKTTRGYYFEKLKKFAIADSIAGISYNTFVFFGSLIFSGLKSVTTEVYVGYVESDFICQFVQENPPPPIDTTIPLEVEDVDNTLDTIQTDPLISPIFTSDSPDVSPDENIEQVDDGVVVNRGE